MLNPKAFYCLLIVIALNLFVDARLVAPILMAKVLLLFVCILFSTAIALGLFVTICLLNIGRINIILGHFA